MLWNLYLLANPQNDLRSKYYVAYLYYSINIRKMSVSDKLVLAIKEYTSPSRKI